jgi:DNA (cytosine-5)-methyltransferase 1
MTEGSMFSGYNGLGLAVTEVFGSRPAWFAENAAAPAKVLAHHWPEVPNLGDVTAVDWSTVEPVDIITAGFPCQDMSVAGLKAGITPGSRSGLWVHVAYAVAALRPRYVILENVRGLTSAPAVSNVEPCPWCVGDKPRRPAVRALGAVLGDLADLRYDAVWCGLRAADVGLPHGRYRLFVLATNADSAGRGEQRRPGTVPAQLATAEHVSNRAARWGYYAPAVARWERTSGTVAPPPTDNDDGKYLSAAFVEWLQGLPPGHVTGVPGVSRSKQLKVLGNGVVPAQATAALAHLLTLTEGVAA